MTSVTDYFTDNSTDYMYEETFYGRHTAQIALKFFFTQDCRNMSYLKEVEQALATHTVS
jgi:uncharacterized protein YxeA